MIYQTPRSTSTDQRLNTIHSLPIEGDGDAAEINIYARGTEIEIGGPRKSQVQLRVLHFEFLKFLFVFYLSYSFSIA
jgi:hypothetical protein